MTALERARVRRLVGTFAQALEEPERVAEFERLLGRSGSHCPTPGRVKNTITGIMYRDEPAILAWEIGNELRCKRCRGTTRYVDTIRELARTLRAQGARQLIADGGEGHDDDSSAYPGLSNTYTVRGDEGASFSKLATLSELDMLSYHFYPGSGKTGLDTGRDARIWIERHEQIARAAGKVAYFGEFGHDLPPERDGERSFVFHGWLGHTLDQSTGSLAVLWQLVPVSREGAKERQYAVVYDQERHTLGVLAFWAASLRRATP